MASMLCVSRLGHLSALKMPSVPGRDRDSEAGAWQPTGHIHTHAWCVCVVCELRLLSYL